MLSIIDPATEALVQEVPEDNAADIQQKATRARQAQPAWAARSLGERIEAIRRFRDLLIQRHQSLASTLTAETGKPISQAMAEINATLDRIDFFVHHVEQVIAPVVVHQAATGVPGLAPLEEIVTQDPLGVVANISAWNYPYFVGSNVFIPALLTGNAVLYKPSEFSTLTGLEIADLFHTAGVPQEIFVPIIGAGPVGATPLEQPLDGVFFTGSYGTGKKIATAAAAQLAKVQLELGGKDPAYVCDDVRDVAAVTAAVADGAFYNNGQSCCSVERIYVHAAIYDEFLAAFLDTIQGFVMGDETFGPMIGIQKVSSDAEAMELMNDTVYGLTAAVYSPNRQRALEILSQVSSGSAYWNCCDRVSPRLPWSGRGHSGIGTTLSVEGIRTFTQPRGWHLKNCS